MSKNKPGVPKGMRDFGPEEMARRTYILDVIKEVFEKYGYQQLETPTMENLAVLTGKYGEEGDQLLYRVLNSGDFLKKTSLTDYEAGYRELGIKIADKGLRYDLTVPFARYVVMNQHALPVPFKRYQIQPVWRADRPQKGRYREFYQCDADVVGTESLICEAEILLMINEVFSTLGVPNYIIKINHRQVLSGLASFMGASDRAGDLFVAIDKLDKIGADKVLQELRDKDFPAGGLNKLEPLLRGDVSLKTLEEMLGNDSEARAGINDLLSIMQKAGSFLQLSNPSADEVMNRLHVAFDVTLARGLSYYTGTIVEVQIPEGGVGSVSGGGRYDNLTAAFGGEQTPGVGFSFGIDRLYDAMENLNLFPEITRKSTDILISNFDSEAEPFALGLLNQLRDAGIKAEIYPEPSKLKKQFAFAEKKGIPFLLLAGSEEIEKAAFGLKNLASGNQETLGLEAILEKFGKKKG
jgi:histidyl-tRNA synthetase